MQNPEDFYSSYPLSEAKPSLRFYFYRSLMYLFRWMQARIDLSKPDGIMRFRRISEWLASTFIRPARAIAVEPQVIGQVPCEWLIPPGADQNSPCMLFLHGGGMVFGYGGPHRRLLSRLALDTNIPVLAVDYSLAPEFPYPKAHQECWAVYETLAISEREFVLVAESSGGALALATLVKAKKAGIAQPILCALISPMVDLTLQADDLVPCVDPFVDPAFSTGLQQMYCRDTQLPNLDLSPLESDLSGLAPLFVMVAEQDILRGEAERLAFTAHEMRVDCQIIVCPHVWHGWHILVGELPEARYAMDAFAHEVLTRIHR